MPQNFQVWSPSGVIQEVFLLPGYSTQKPPMVVCT